MTDIEDLHTVYTNNINMRITPIVYPYISDHFSQDTVSRIDSVLLILCREPTKNITSLLREHKLSIKHITLLHRYRQLVKEGKMTQNQVLEFALTQKKGRMHSGVEVIAVSTYPEGEFVGCPADCYYCPKEPEAYFDVRILCVFTDKDKIAIQIEEVNKQDKYYVQVINKIIIDGIDHEVLYSHNHSSKIVLFFAHSSFTILPVSGQIVGAYKTAQPRSYVSSEPAVARANQTGWNCVAQFREIAGKRILCGHEITKVEAIVIGGTWSYYGNEYQERFIRDIYYAANTLYDTLPLRAPDNLENEKLLNETTKCRIIGLTLETRPDFITYTEIKKLLRYGCTRVQIGVQHLDDNVLRKINRGCQTKDTIKAIRLLKNAGFKVDIHLMPDLPNSSFWSDFSMLSDVLRNEKFQADQWKIYPCQTMEHTVIKEWYESGQYKPYFEEEKIIYSDNVYVDYFTRQLLKQQEFLQLFCLFLIVYFALVHPASAIFFMLPCFCLVYQLESAKVYSYKSNPLFHLLVHFIPRVPEWIRLNRIIRDNPSHTIVGGLNKPHYRNLLEEHLYKTGRVSRDIRNREIRGRKYDTKAVELRIRKYRSSGGIELFISYEDIKNDYLLGFARLRIPSRNEMGQYIPEVKNSSLLRELHVYGWMVPQGNSSDVVQHRGLGQKLIRTAEVISRYYGYNRMTIISGVGVREYYRNKLGYYQSGAYMTRFLDRETTMKKSPLQILWAQSRCAVIEYCKYNFYSKLMSS